MDIKSRRSSLRRSIFSKEDENIAAITPRLKRRISFSGRHLVREFHREEEPKTWENSYEISDHMNMDETGPQLCATISGAECSTHNFSVIDKENMSIQIQPPLSLNSTDSKERLNVPETAQNGSVLSNTRDLINTTQNATLCIENSVDVTLFEKEKQCFRKYKDQQGSQEMFAGENTTKNINSFSLDENEVRALADLRYTVLGEKTIDFMQDIGNNATNVVTNKDQISADIEYEHNVKETGVAVSSDTADEGIGRDAKESITIYMNDSLSVTLPENPTSSRKTIQSSVTIMVSPENKKGCFIEKDNIKLFVSSNANVTLNSSCIMDFTGNTELLNKSPNVNKEENDFQEKLDKISFFHPSDDKMIIENLLPDEGETTSLDARTQKRQTVGFNHAIESSPVKFKGDSLGGSLYLNEYIKESPVKTKFSKEQENNSEIRRKSNQPPNLMVQKIYKQITENSDITNDLENRSKQLCHKKKQKQNACEIITMTALRDPQDELVHENSLSFSLSNVEKVSLSPDSFSQLIPTEYKTYNFKQLNDEIDRGRIQLFPKTPTTERKSKENIHFTKKMSELPKERRTLFFENDISISPDITSRNNSKPLGTDDYIKQKKGVIAKCRFSQADDLMLDNTSFLTRAKLGDETASRNSTKRDLTQLNDIDIFNGPHKDARSQMGGAIAELKKAKNCRDNTTNYSLHSTLNDANPVFNHGITSLKDSFMESIQCYIEKRAEEHTLDSNVNHKHRQTIHLNEDIVLSKNGLKDYSFKPECRNHTPCTLETDSNEFMRVKGTPFNFNDEMDLEERQISSIKIRSEHALEPGPGDHVPHTTPTVSSMESDLKSSRQVATDMESTNYQHGIIGSRYMKPPPKGESIRYINSDIEMYCTRDDDYKTLPNLDVENKLQFGAQRKTIYFENCVIEKDLPVVCDDVPCRIDVDAKPFSNYETDNSVAANMNESIEIEPLTKRLTRNTLHFRNESIETDEHTGEHPNDRSILNSSLKVTDVKANDPCIKTLQFQNEILVNVDIINDTDNYDVEDLSHCETLKTEHSQCTKYFEDGVNIKNIECQKKFQCNLDRNTSMSFISQSPLNQTLCTHHLTETGPVSQQQPDGMLAAFRISPKNTKHYFDANMDISMEENNHNDSKKDIISQPNVNIHDINKSTHESNVNEKFLISDDAGTGTKCSLESRHTAKTILLPHGMDRDESVQTSNETLLRFCQKESSHNTSITRNNKDFCRSNIDRQSTEGKSTRRALYFNPEMPKTVFSDNLQSEKNEIKNNFEALHISNDEIQKLGHDTLNNDKMSVSNLNTSGFHYNITYADNNKHVSTNANFEKEIPCMENVRIEQSTSSFQNLQRKTTIFNENDKHSHIKCENYILQQNYRQQKEIFTEFEQTYSNYIKSDGITSAQNQRSSLRKSPLKNILEINNKETTPLKYFEVATPRKSLDEFLAYEKRTEKDGMQCGGDLNDNQCQSSGYNEISIKRLPSNLTPISSVPKKRQALEIYKHEANEAVPAVMAKCNKLKTKCDVTGVQITNEHMLVSATDESLLGTMLKTRLSRIPLPSSSDKIMETSSDHSTFHNVNEVVETIISDSILEDVENITDSIQGIRKATTLHRREGLHHIERINSPELRGTLKPAVFEDNPITISDVSVYFHDQRKGMANNCDMTHMAPTEEIKFKSFHKRYMNLTCDSPLEDIDQTRISLVRTLSDEDEDESKEHSVEIDCDVACYVLPATCSQIATQAHLYNIDKRNERLETMSTAKQLQNVSSMCRKCKRCQITFINESTSSAANSFVLPSLPSAPTLDMNRLRRLRTRPHISDVNVLWQRSSLNRTILNPNNVFNGENMSLSDNACLDCPVVTSIIGEYKSDIQRFTSDDMASKTIKSAFAEPSIVCHLNDILRHSNWILDVQMQYNGMLVFIYRKMLTFSLIMNYEVSNAFGTALQLKSIEYDSKHIPESNWQPIDFILDFQFKLNSPYDLLVLCENCTKSGVSRMIRKIEQVCIETILMGVQLQRIVFHHGSSIIRDENRSFVRKIARKIVSAPGNITRVENVEIRIELLNIKKMSFKDITMPALHTFSEDIHLLPVGLPFLNKFLQNPLFYLKHIYNK